MLEVNWNWAWYLYWLRVRGPPPAGGWTKSQRALAR